MSQWNSPSIKAHLRLTSQRLGQLQEKQDSQASITRRDIATLLQNGNVGLARAKAQKLIKDDVIGDLMEVLEMHVGLILEHWQEIEQSVSSPSPSLVEAAASIIYSTSYLESKELQTVAEILAQRLGIDFFHSSIGNRDKHVSSRVLKAVSDPPPSVEMLDTYLMNVSKTYSVNWTPEPHRQEILNELAEILDSDTNPVVDLPRLRKLCSRGIPDEPAWLRPRIWKLCLGTLPVLKGSWSSSLQQQRASYYELVRRLLEPFSALPPPTIPLATLDASLQNLAAQLSRIPSGLFVNLEGPPEHASVACPLDESAPSEVKISCANNLDTRLKTILDHRPLESIQQVDPENTKIPEISLFAPESSTSQRPNIPTLLISAKSYNTGNAHPYHASALLRLLYVHSSINPGNLSPHIPSLLVPLYSVLCQEVEADDLAHAEADAFWLFEAMVGEFSELEDEEGGNLWMKKFGERLLWADPDLHESLHAKGLDPALPHYSYRWLAPLLTQTLPLRYVLVVWDALFSYPMRERNSDAKLEFLLDVCSSMIIRARAVLFRLGKNDRRSPGLWAEEPNNVPPPSPLRAWELGDAFMEGMSLLREYPVHLAGGIDGVLQTASELAQRRTEETKASRGESLSLGARLRVSMWKGFTNQTSSPDRSPDASDEESSDEEAVLGTADKITSTSVPPSLTSRLATTVWRGITNQSSMETPPSPLSPMTPSQPPSPTTSLTPAAKESFSPKIGSLGIWGYAEKLKESDAAAAISKASTNWRAKALLGSWGYSKNEPNAPPISEMFASSRLSVSPAPQDSAYMKIMERRTSSLPDIDRTDLYSPPARPAYFRPPRDSMMFHGRTLSVTSTPSSPEMKPPIDGGLLSKAQNLQASLAALTGPQKPPPKSGPRPLLLNSSSLITSTPKPRPISRTDSQIHTPNRVVKSHSRGSQSSISSLAPSDAFGRLVRTGRSEWDSDGEGPSRRIPLNRKSISPMAPTFNMRPASQSSSGWSSDRGIFSPPEPPSTLSEERRGSPSGWGQVDADSPPLVSPPPRTSHDNIRIKGSEDYRGSVIIGDPHVSPLEPPPQTKKLVRKKTPPTQKYAESEASDSAFDGFSKSPRLRLKRHPRPANLRLQEQSVDALSLQIATEETNDLVLTPKASSFDGGSSPTKAPRRRKVSGEVSDRPRKISTEGSERPRKISSSRARKLSGEGQERRRHRDSAAEADDEGYDDLLSAYESEEGVGNFLR